MSIQLIKKIGNKIGFLYKCFVLRDPFLLTAKHWFSDRGDATLRLDYKLDSSSIVFDVGGYIGDYAEDVYKKFGCQIFVFEPVPSFFNQCVERFSGKPLITCLNYGLSSKSGWFEITLNNNQSSFNKADLTGIKQKAEVRSISEVVSELGIEKIDLIKINIEGGEFDLLPAIIDSGVISRITYIQVQFHNFDPNAIESRSKIRQALEKTHREMWNYEFLWESWELR